jgi:hypothetical protein
MCFLEHTTNKTAGSADLEFTLYLEGYALGQ